MSSGAERGRAVFFASVLKIVFSQRDGSIVADHLRGWIPDVVYQKLGTGVLTTAEGIVAKCGDNAVLDEAFYPTIEKLNSDWDRLKAEKRRDLIQLIHQHRMEKHFEAYMLTLSPADDEALAIRWDAAEILYDQEKQRLLRNARSDDGDAPDLLRLGNLSEVFELLLELLRNKVDYDLSAVVLGAQGHAAQLLETVVGRCHYEYLDCLDLFRPSLRRFLLSVQAETGGSKRSLTADVERILEPFKESFEKFEKNISSSIKNDSVFEAMKCFIREHDRRIIKEVTKVERTTNIYGPSVNLEHGNAEHFTQNQNTGSMIAHLDMPTLAGELARLRAAAQNKASSSDELRSVADLAEAEEAAKKGDRNTTVQKLAKIGKWIFDLAKEIGASIAAKLIGEQIGIG